MELVVAIAVLTMLSVFAAAQWATKVQQFKIDAMAAWLLDIYHAASTPELMVSHSGKKTLDILRPNHSQALFINRLKRLGYLTQGFSAHAPMNYQIGVVPAGEDRCQASPCLAETLLVAVPDEKTDSDTAQRDAWDLLLALSGRGGAVPVNRPGHVSGAGMQYDGVRWKGQLLPVGSVALLLRGAAGGGLLPYVRLREARPVTLDGYVTMGGTARFMQVAHLEEGIAIGRTVVSGHACQTYNQIALLAGGGLALCMSGRWTPMRQAHHFKACDATRSAATDLYQQGLMVSSGLGFVGGMNVVECICSAGFIARYLGPATNSFQGVTVTGGFLCESL